MLEEAVVEARVVGDEEAAVEARARPRAATDENVGAPRTIASVMPVSAWIAGGIGTPGSTSERPLVDPRRPAVRVGSTRTMPTSVIRSARGAVPVVSRSTKASGRANRLHGGVDEGGALTGERSFAMVARMSNDRSYLESLQDYYARHRALPSYASIGGLLGLKSKSSVAALVARLKLAGFLESTPDRRLAPTRRFFARPLATPPVRAGLPERIDDSAPTRSRSTTT